MPFADLPINCDLKSSSVALAPRPAVSLCDKTVKPVSLFVFADTPIATLTSPPYPEGDVAENT